MIMTTTTLVEGRPVQQYLGVVTGEAILGAHIFRDLFAGIRDIVGGRSGSYEKVLREAREVAWPKWPPMPPSWAATLWSASTSTTRPSARPAPC